jgi:hypothetical protein
MARAEPFLGAGDDEGENRADGETENCQTDKGDDIGRIIQC